MGMENLLEEMQAKVDARTNELIEQCKQHARELAEKSWSTNDSVTKPATKEARDSASYFMMGMSRKLIAATPEPMAALSIAPVLIDSRNVSMLENLLFVAYLRGVSKALELTGQDLPSGEPNPEEAQCEINPTTEDCPGSINDLKREFGIADAADAQVVGLRGRRSSGLVDMMRDLSALSQLVEEMERREQQRK